MSKSSSHLEIELKLAGAPDAFKCLLKDVKKEGYVIDKRGWRVQTYYDTHDFDLFAHDIELRVRPAKEDFRQTLKSLVDLSPGGVFTRTERQSAQSDELPDLAALKKLLPSSVKHGHLHPLMRTEFARKRFEIVHQESLIECAVDEGLVVFIGGEMELVRPFQMLELELKHGRKEGLIAFGATLEAHYSLVPMRLTKPEMAVQLGFNSEALPHRDTWATVAAKLQRRLG